MMLVTAPGPRRTPTPTLDEPPTLEQATGTQDGRAVAEEDRGAHGPQPQPNPVEAGGQEVIVRADIIAVASNKPRANGCGPLPPCGAEMPAMQQDEDKEFHYSGRVGER